MRKLLITVSLCGALMVACEPMEAQQYNPQSNSKEERSMENCSKAVADIMGIQWTSESGATEKLDTFNKRVKECMNG